MTSSYKKYFDPAQIESDQKDLVVSQLKAELFELRQNERDYNELHSKLNNLEHRYNLLQEEKSLNEREFKNRNELNLRTINNLKSDIDTLKQELNVLSADAQDLRFDNQSINEIVNNRSSEIGQLKAELGDLSDNNSHLAMEKKDLETQISRVRTENRENNLELEETNHQIGEATERRNKFERLIRELEYENERLEKTNEDFQRQQDGLRLEIRNKVDNTKYNEQLYSENRKQIIALEADLNDLRRINEKTKNEIATHQKNQQVEQSKNLESQSRINKLDALIKERDYEVSNLRGEYDELKRDQVKLLDTNDDLNHDIDACSRHLDLLTLQNNELLQELERFNYQDQEVRQVLDRKDKVEEVKKRYEGKMRSSFHAMSASIRSPLRSKEQQYE
jgi:chromosome segregation ATPase